MPFGRTRYRESGQPGSAVPGQKARLRRAMGRGTRLAASELDAKSSQSCPFVPPKRDLALDPGLPLAWERAEEFGAPSATGAARIRAQSPMLECSLEMQSDVE